MAEFDEWAGSYERSPCQLFFSRAHKAALEAARADFDGSSPKSILDVGCATGRLLRSAAHMWPEARLTGVDPSEDMLVVARGLQGKAVFLEGLAEALPLPDSSMDLVMTTLSFHHWDYPMKGLREIRRVLAPGGRFCFADVNLPRFLTPVIQHFGSRTARQLSAMFERAGLHVTAKKRAMAWTTLVLIAQRK